MMTYSDGETLNLEQQRFPWDGHDKVHFEGLEKRRRENSPMIPIPLFKNRT